MCVNEKTFRFLVRALLAVFVLVAANLSIANAQQHQIPSVAAFLTNPGHLLLEHPVGGPLMTNEVQQLALADPSTFRVLLSLLVDANDLQKRAIADGLAQAAKIEVLTDQTLAADWQQQIAVIDDPTFKRAATDAFGDVQLGAVGQGPLGGGGGGPAGPQGPTTAGPPEDLRSHAIPTSGFTYTATTTAATSPSHVFTNPTRTHAPGPASPVSP